MKLYDMLLSGNCYKIRLFLNLLKLSYRSVPVDLKRGEHKSAPFLKLNPKGQVPVLQDGAMTVADSGAILVYLASKYGESHWYPDEAETRGHIQTWLATAANEVFNGPARVRAIKLFGRDFDYETSVQSALAVLDLFESHLEKRPFLVGNTITIADMANFPYIALVGDGGIDLKAYPAIGAWIRRIRELPRFITMPGL